MNKPYAVPAITVVIIIGLIGIVAFTVLRKVEETESREYRIVIPEGTGALIDAGEDPDVVPEHIELTLGEKDILVIENKDIVGHRISDFWVGAGETLRQSFKTPAVYQGECTIHESTQIQIVVLEP